MGWVKIEQHLVLLLENEFEVCFHLILFSFVPLKGVHLLDHSISILSRFRTLVLILHFLPFASAYNSSRILRRLILVKLFVLQHLINDIN